MKSEKRSLTSTRLCERSLLFTEIRPINQQLHGQDTSSSLQCGSSLFVRLLFEEKVWKDLQVVRSREVGGRWRSRPRGRCTFHVKSTRRQSKAGRLQTHLGFLGERPELSAHFGGVEARVRGCRFDSLGVIFKVDVCRPLETGLVLLYEQHGVLQGDQQAPLEVTAAVNQSQSDTRSTIDVRIIIWLDLINWEPVLV